MSNLQNGYGPADVKLAGASSLGQPGAFMGIHWHAWLGIPLFAGGGGAMAGYVTGAPRGTIYGALGGAVGSLLGLGLIGVLNMTSSP